ncbi:MAG TPA: DUF2586 family protein, partial [Cytophagaceae bacterium]|nr:DUF2586 family protein [Cytophagaceae bacterium]
MALNDVTFVKGQGGLGRPLDGEDHISGIVFYTNTYPSGFDSSHKVKTVYSIDDTEALGILLDYSDETQATGTYLVTTAGTAGDVITFSVVETNATVVIGSYTVANSDTEALVAAGIAAAINAGTSTHGYSATAPSATVTITARKGLGIFLNTGTPIAVNISTGGTIAGTLTQFTGGVASFRALMWYHISEYFRIQPKGVLYVGVFPVPGSYTFSEVSDVQSFAVGIIRQIAVYTTVNFATTQITALQTVAASLSTDHTPLSILFGANIPNTTNLSDLTDLGLLNSSYVSLVIGQDGNNFGHQLYLCSGKSITCLGATLGAVSRSKVSENIGWVKNYNMADTELDVIAFANGKLYRDVSTNSLDTLNTQHYIFLRKHIGISGSYFNDSYTAVISTSDYSTIENNRTIDKAIRNIRTFIIPELNGPLFVDPVSGQLSEDTIAYFTSLTSGPLEQMQRDGELSGFGVT